MMDEVCVMAFGEDLGYWGIDELRSLEATRLNICFVHPIYRFLFLVTFVDKLMKIQKYYVIFVYILQGKMGKTEKNEKKIPQIK